MNDTFRIEYKELTQEQKDQMVAVKKKAQELFDLIDTCYDPSERSERARLINAGKTGIEIYMAGGIIKGITAPQD